MKKNYKFSATVKYTSNGYFAGEIVRGNKIKKEKDGSYWLFDDEEIDGLDLISGGLNEWVEIDLNSLIDYEPNEI